MLGTIGAKLVPVLMKIKNDSVNPAQPPIPQDPGAGSRCNYTT